MELFDTHFHWEKEIEPEYIASEALQNNVKYLVCVGGDYQSSIDSLNFSKLIKNAYFSVGVHPHCADKEIYDIKKFAALLKEDKCVAVGEIGLDYYYENSQRDIQKEVFTTFCRLGKKENFPLIIHCRDKDNIFEAYEDVYKILKENEIKEESFVIHCYTGDLYWLEKFLSLGAYIGITGIVTFPKAENVRNITRHIPSNRLLLETDSPYLAPVPYRSKPNYPKYLNLVAEEVAKIRDLPLEELSELTTRNAFRFYTL